MTHEVQGQDRENQRFYRNPQNIIGLAKFGFLFSGLIFTVFISFLSIGASNSSIQITVNMLAFYGILSVCGGFGGIIVMAIAEHPNKWVARTAFVFSIVLLFVVKYMS